MLSRHILRVGVIAALGSTGLTFDECAFAGARPQVDLSVGVSVDPSTFMPGGTNTVTMTVHNAGPDEAGAVLGGDPYIVVYERPYDIVNRPPPFYIPEHSVGCTAYVEESEYIPGVPGGGITLMFTYWFGAIPAGQSRTCTYRTLFLPTTVSGFPTYWRVGSYANDDDINPDNDRFDYTFVAAPAGPPIAVPMLSKLGNVLLCTGCLLLTYRMPRRTWKLPA